MQGTFLKLRHDLSTTASIDASYYKAILHVLEGMLHHVQIMRYSFQGTIAKRNATLRLFSE